MMDFKEMTIGRTPHGSMAQLPLSGRWLENIGFITGTLVSAVYQDACLTLSVSHAPAPNASSVIPVKSKLIRGKPRTQLTLDGFLLKRYGFHAGDRVVLCFMKGMIQITRINNFTTVKLA